MTDDNPRIAVLALLTKRSAEQTICPSEVARSLANDAGSPADWRSEMPAVHEAVDELLADGVVQLSWKGKLLDKRTGPYRIRIRRTRG